MPNTKKQTNRFIKHYPDLFSFKFIIFKKIPDKDLNKFKTFFFISFGLVGTFNTVIKTNIIVSSLILVFAITFEIIYLTRYKKWLDSNSYYYDLINIDYFQKNNLYSKNDYLIMLGKINEYKKSWSSKKNISIPKISVVISILMPIIITFTMPSIKLIHDYLKKNPKQIPTQVFGITITICILIILILLIIYYHKVNFQSQRNLTIESLKKIESNFFDKTTGQFKIKLLKEKMNENKSKTEFIMIEQYISNYLSKQKTK